MTDWTMGTTSAVLGGTGTRFGLADIDSMTLWRRLASNWALRAMLAAASAAELADSALARALAICDCWSRYSGVSV
jgi:hypothetical protein